MSNLIHIPPFRNPEEFGYRVYSDYVKEYNRSRIDAVRSYLSTTCADRPLHQNSGCALVTTGSDGRFENGKSRVELVIYTTGNVKFEEELEGVRRRMREGTGRDVFEDSPEVRDVEGETLSYYENNRSRVFPARVTDALYVFGDAELVERAKRKLFDEITGKEGRRILDEANRKRLDCRKVMTTGQQSYKGRNIRHYSLEDGEAYYDPQNGVCSFKHGPLRLVQLAFNRDFLRFARRNGDVNTILKMPQNTGERLYFILADDLSTLSAAETSDLVDSYAYFLWQYHRSQRNFSEREVGTTHFYGKEAMERINAIDRILPKSDDPRYGKSIFKI